MTGDILPYIIEIAVMVMLSAYFSATETAFSSLNKTRLKTLAERGNGRAQLALKLTEKYDKLISTILIGNNIVNIALASIATVMFVRLYGDIGATISTAVITVIVLIFGEISPKSIAKDCPEKFAMFSAPIINSLIWLLTPINFVFTMWKKLLSKLLKVQGEEKISQEELLMLVDEAQQDGGIDTEEGTLLRNAIEFNGREVEDILTHRVDLEAVSIEDDKEEIARVFSESKFSRLLVYEDSIDNIVGVIHQKDFYQGSGLNPLPLKDIITPPIFVMQSEKIDDILRKLQKNKSHIAVVIDEYGGTYGIVTMEDILEELVGDIWDEHDEVDIDFKKTGENTYIVGGQVDMEDFCEFFDVEEPEEETISVGGWVMKHLEKIPDLNDSFVFENLNITVSAVEFHRVTAVSVKCEPKLDDEEGKAPEHV